LKNFYDASTPEVRKWISENVGSGNKKPVAGAGHSSYVSIWKPKNSRLAYRK